MAEPGREPSSSAAPDAASAPPGAIVACGPDERDEQVRLFNACFKKTLDVRALRWRYEQSPHGPASSFVTRVEGAGAVSGYACTPRRALSFGDESRMSCIGETGDVMTHPDWRKRGYFSALDRAAMQAGAARGWPIVFGLPNRRSAHIFVELGWKEVGTIRPWWLVLRSDDAARAERARSGRLAAWRTPFDAWRGARSRASLRRSGGGRFRVRLLEEFPPEVQELSRVTERDFALMLRRDREWLTWRFLRAPSKLHRVLGVFDETGDWRGYAVVQLPREGGNGVGWLVDVLVRGDEARAAAVAAGLELLGESGASVVNSSAIDGSWWSSALRASGFRPANDAQALSVIVWTNAPEHPLARAAQRASDWHLTDADRDDETVG